MSYTPQHKQETRDRVLRSARRLLDRKGFADVTIAMTGDPLFLVLVGIVGVGFLTLFSYLTDRRKLARSPLAPRKRRMATFWRPAELSGDVVVEATVKSLRLRPRKKLISSSVAPTRNHKNMLVGCVAEVVG